MKITVFESAKRHNLAEDEIRHAINNIVCDRTKRRKGELIHFAVGVLPNGKTCELLFFVEHFCEVKVFHAMSPARNQFVKDVQKRRKD